MTPDDAGAGSTVAGWLRAIAVMAVTTAVAWAARSVVDIPDTEMLFLLGVMIAALTSGRGPSVLAAALGVAGYDFFFVPPHFTLGVGDARYVLSFAMMFGVGVLISSLTHRIREQSLAAVLKERRTAALYALARDLGATLDEAGVAAVAVRTVAAAFDVEAMFLPVRGGEPGEPLAAAPPGAALTAAERPVARWAAEHGHAAGHGAESFPGEAVLCVPLRTFGDVLAVVAVRAGARGLGGEQRALLEALGRQAALALDRVRLAAEARQAALRASTEELRSRLLSAVSHDLRTPLAAITGAGTLLREEAALDPALRRELTETVCDEAERLERLVSNLLDMTRLDSGAVEPHREWVPLVEVVGSALTRLERRLSGRRIVTAIADVPLLSIDPVLVEQLLLNLLENAAKYTPPGSEIGIRVEREGGAVAVEVADRGPGIPPGEEERIFERFHRVAKAGVRGVGLGLPIARAIAEAHGGRLVAGNRPGGGAVFRLTLPVPEQQPPAEPPSGDEASAGADGVDPRGPGGEGRAEPGGRGASGPGGGAAP